MRAPLRALMAGLVDYAGLFPPAALPMAEVVRNYDSYLGADHAWMLGRLILPATRLEEYAAALGECGAEAAGWRLSVLAGPNEREAVEGFSRRHPGCGRIDTVETRASNAEEIEAAGRAWAAAGDDAADAERTADSPHSGQPGARAAMPFQLYVETPPERWRSLLPALGRAQARAKLRTGGVTPDAIPPESQVLEFLRLAAARRIAFKATAGLHHPLRSLRPLTYAADAPRASMHGFLNVFCAAALLWHRPELRQEAAWMLAESDPDAITMDEMTMSWHNSGVSLTAEEIAAARSEFAIGFGSCSFREPTADLEAMGWL